MFGLDTCVGFSIYFKTKLNLKGTISGTETKVEKVWKSNLEEVETLRLCGVIRSYDPILSDQTHRTKFGHLLR